MVSNSTCAHEQPKSLCTSSIRWALASQNTISYSYSSSPAQIFNQKSPGSLRVGHTTTAVQHHGLETDAFGIFMSSPTTPTRTPWESKCQATSRGGGGRQTAAVQVSLPALKTEFHNPSTTNLAALRGSTSSKRLFPLLPLRYGLVEGREGSKSSFTQQYP